MVDPDNRGEGAPPRHVHIEGAEKSKFNWLPWLLAALGLLLLLFTLSRCNDREERVVPVDNTVNDVAVDTNVVAEPVTTGAAATGAAVGATAGVAAGNASNEMRTFLGGTEAAPRRFTFNNINFATGSAEMPGDASGTVNEIADVLKAYPNSRVRVEGYADARGTEPANAELGANRARAVATALTAAGIAANRIETATGGENNPVDSNSTAGGRAENRRTDVVILSR